MTQRIKRINQLLKQELGKIVLREGNFPKEIFITITRVETLANLREAKVWISVLPEADAEKIVKILTKRIYFFQQKLNKILKIKFVPKISFQIETKTREAARIEEILENLKKDGK